MKMLVAGKWIDRDEQIEVLNPYDGSVVGTVPIATEEDIEEAISKAVEGAKVMKKTPIWKRVEVLEKAAELIEKRSEEMSVLLVKESGKTIREARAEVLRTAGLFRLSAEEAKRIHGETLPFDSLKGSEKKKGYFIREPVGIVAAIVPFNVPLALCAHKIGPAIAAGNAVIIKPPTQDPLTNLILGEILLEAGLPPEALSILTGPGGKVGTAIVRDRRIRMVSFTGSVSVGKMIMQNAGLKKVALELGSNSPLIVTETGNLEKAVKATVSGGFSQAGQVCISVQRVYVQRTIYEDFVDLLIKEVSKLKTGDPMKEETDMGPVIDEANAIRIEEWIREAVEKGAKIGIGGNRKDTLIQPTVLLHVPKDTKMMTEELFGPAVAVNAFESFDEALKEANSTKYGLQAGVFTSKIDEAFRAIETLEFGGVLINEGPRYRADFMPYGGYKESGIGREGIRFALEEMMEIKTIIFDQG
ncbi:aldehyde dehydrogenase family protein [Thermotoga sp. KOL6]|uniref:aldehyde dehydrogenase family protein n=1 Tax=Thermotoga sp. KOL6 TaxID=126741 RepID=UPI000C76DEAB|nr:aldehyde dehydrogenase family protein [Thermotoga sp. KOL6]PLV59158.1 aldehyde dehydrogenase [Thermotoga sp. KOL6]